MPGSYYSDVERTIFLTYVILMEDVAKYDELFQQVSPRDPKPTHISLVLLYELV